MRQLLTDIDFSLLLKSTETSKCLKLNNVVLTPSQVAELKQIQGLKEVSFCNSGGPVRDFVTADLRRIKISKAGIDLILESLIDKLLQCPNLTEVDFSDGNLTNIHMWYIAELLAKHPNALFVKLNNNAISSEGVATLCQGIQQTQNQHQLHLENNRFAEKGIATLTGVIGRLKGLHIKNETQQRYPSTRVIPLLEALRDNTSLESLTLNMPSQKGTRCLANSLAVNTTLKYLEICRDTYTGDMIYADTTYVFYIKKLLQSNVGLTYLRFIAVRFGLEEQRILIEACQKNPSLKHLLFRACSEAGTNYTPPISTQQNLQTVDIGRYQSANTSSFYSPWVENMGGHVETIYPIYFKKLDQNFEADHQRQLAKQALTKAMDSNDFMQNWQHLKPYSSEQQIIHRLVDVLIADKTVEASKILAIENRRLVSINDDCFFTISADDAYSCYQLGIHYPQYAELLIPNALLRTGTQEQKLEIAARGEVMALYALSISYEFKDLANAVLLNKKPEVEGILKMLAQHPALKNNFLHFGEPMNALCLAAYRGNVVLFELLAEHYQDSQLDAALGYAIKKGRSHVVTAALERNVSPQTHLAQAIATAKKYPEGTREDHADCIVSMMLKLPANVHFSETAFKSLCEIKPAIRDCMLAKVAVEPGDSRGQLQQKQQLLRDYQACPQLHRLIIQGTGWLPRFTYNSRTEGDLAAAGDALTKTITAMPAPF